MPFIFILYSALCRDSDFTFLSICIVLFSVFVFSGDDRYIFLYIFFVICFFCLFVRFVCFIHQSRLIRSCYILFIKQQAFGKLKKKIK